MFALLVHASGIGYAAALPYVLIVWTRNVFSLPVHVTVILLGNQDTWVASICK